MISGLRDTRAYAEMFNAWANQIMGTHYEFALAFSYVLGGEDVGHKELKLINQCTRSWEF